MTETEAGQLAVGECTATAAICPEEALLAGGFLVGYVGATKVLHWAFGSGGDDRSFLSSSAPGWSWQTSGGYSAPPTPGPSSGFLANLVRTDASTYANGLTSTWWCMTTTGSVGDPVSGGAINSVASGSGMSAQVACGGATPLVYRVQWVGAHTLFATAPVIQRWTYDPPKPWSVSVHVRCLNTDGTTFEVSGGVVSVASSAGGTATPDLTLPSCTAVTPTAAPQVVYLTGGRASDDPDGILMAAPISRTTTSTVTTPDPQPTGSTGTGTPASGDNPSSDPEVGVTTGADTASCFGSGWSWNPVDWVLVPVKCALKWAFYDGDLATQWGGFAGDIGTRAPWSFILAGPVFINGFINGFEHPSTCTGTNTGNAGAGLLPDLPLNSLQPWCALQPSDGSGIWTVATMRKIADAGIWIAFLWACYHRAKRLIGDSGPNDPSGDPEPSLADQLNAQYGGGT